jgi:chemotaxis protein MotB
MKPLLDTVDDEVQIWPSYTDVALNIILILLVYVFAQAVIYSRTSAALVAIAQRQEVLRREVLDAVPPALRDSVTIVADGNLLRIRFADRVLFDLAQADLKEEGQKLLAVLGTVLKRHLSSSSQIQIEGHTDDAPIKTARFASNWELSSARATSVVRFLQDSAAIVAPQLSATGYAEYHPVDARDTPEAKARNRRIEMLIVYTTREETR